LLPGVLPFSLLNHAIEDLPNFAFDDVHGGHYRFETSFLQLGYSEPNTDVAGLDAQAIQSPLDFLDPLGLDIQALGCHVRSPIREWTIFGCRPLDSVYWNNLIIDDGVPIVLFGQIDFVALVIDS
jgi:hypothetical protein